jgi:hypothetical protein
MLDGIMCVEVFSKWHYWMYCTSLYKLHTYRKQKIIMKDVLWALALCRSCVNRRSQKTTFFIVTSVNTSNLTKNNSSFQFYWSTIERKPALCSCVLLLNVNEAQSFVQSEHSSVQFKIWDPISNGSVLRQRIAWHFSKLQFGFHI